MGSEKYVGLDVHKDTISIAVMNSAGKLIMESIIETKAITILQFIQGLQGDVYVTFEEGTWAAWLYDLLKPHVTQVVVCNPRENALLKQGSKSDQIDARKLAELLRLGSLSAVYHGEHGLRMLTDALGREPDCRHCPFGQREPRESFYALCFVGDVAHGRVLVDHCSVLPCDHAKDGTVAGRRGNEQPSQRRRPHLSGSRRKVSPSCLILRAMKAYAKLPKHSSRFSLPSTGRSRGPHSFNSCVDDTEVIQMGLTFAGRPFDWIGRSASQVRGMHSNEIVAYNL